MALVEVRDLWYRYPGTGHGAPGEGGDGWALRGLDLEFEAGSRLGIVGESGSGKSTLVRVLCALLKAKRGSVSFDGRSLVDWSEDIREFRSRNQMVFQSPASSLDPRMRVGFSLSEPVRAIERRNPDETEIESWLSAVGLGREVLPRYPHQLSGGQLQRIAIARALSLRPTVLYADEPTSALDVSVQAQVLNLLIDLREQFGLTLVMVSHDLAVISRLCESIIVMKDGEIVETGRTVDVLRRPSSAYTASLIAAAEAVSLAADG
ncbi:MAG: ABC transporter ATP-binding protein [Acidimicrobiia bacterium]